MIHAKISNGALVPCDANDPDAHVLFSVAEARDNVVRRDRVKQTEVNAMADAKAQGNEPEALRYVALWALGKDKSPYEPKE